MTFPLETQPKPSRGPAEASAESLLVVPHHQSAGDLSRVRDGNASHISGEACVREKQMQDGGDMDRAPRGDMEGDEESDETPDAADVHLAGHKVEHRPWSRKEDDAIIRIVRSVIDRASAGISSMLD